MLKQNNTQRKASNQEGTKMNPIETIISKKLKEADPAMDTEGADRKIPQTAYHDFINYLKFTWKLDEKTDNNETVEKITKLIKEEPEESEAFLTVWTGMWLKKWKQRVKIILGNQKQENTTGKVETTNNSEQQWKNLENKQEMVEMIVTALIKNGEICGTQILAENILKTEAGKTKTPELNSTEQTLTVLNSALRRARDIANNKGPLIFVKVDKGYYKESKQ